MPMDWSRYPVDWRDVAFAVKDANGWTCAGCGKQCRRPGEPFDTHERTLTVAHWDHDNEEDNVFVVALCAPCHLRHDAERKGADRKRKRIRALGQLEIGGLL